MNVRKIASLLHYSPKDRNYEEALKFLNSNIKFLKENKINLVVTNLEIPEQIRREFSNKQMKELLSTIFINGFETNKKDSENIAKYIFKGNFDKDDNINNSKVQFIIKKGLDIMKKSKDPFHDISHIIRCIRFASYIYDNTNCKLDWGILTAAIVWHDVSRVNDLGFLYRNNLQSLRKIPLLQEINLIDFYKDDSLRSGKILRKIFCNYKLDDNFIKKVESAVAGIDKDSGDEYQKFIHDIDAIDSFTIGRWESSNRNVVYSHMADKDFLNKSLVMCFIFLVPRYYNGVHMDVTKNICKLSVAANLSHSRRFYPTDHQFIVNIAKELGYIM